MVAAVVLAACAPAPATVQAAFPGTNGKLAFSSARDGFPADSDLYTMAGDGATQTRITSFDGDELYPSWSKDGTKMVFDRNAGLRPDVWVANADGSNATQLTQDAAGDEHAAWAPSGAKIVFASDRDDTQGTSDLFVMNADGSAEVNITNTPGIDEDYPSWSPGGTRVAFSRDGDIYTANTDGTSLAALTNTAEADIEPDWSPDGNQIVFHRGYGSSDEIWKMNSNGTAQANLTNNGSVVDERPSWSPAGDKIAFVRGAFNSAEVYVMNTDGSGATQLTSNAQLDAQPAWQPIPLPPPPPPLTGYPRPKGATPLEVALVPAFRPCKYSNRTHGPPLAHPSCNPPKTMSRYLTVGTPDANQKPAGFWGRFSARTVVGSPATPGDQADVAVAIVLNDVRNSSDLTDYTGELRVRSAYRRQTDRASGPTESGGTEPATGVDTTWGFVMSCAATASTSTGSTCRLVTSVDALNPGAVKEGGRAIMELGQMQVYDGGPDGLAQTQDNLVFAVQGLFVP
jgi:Tol biopolymer transport system component